MKHQPSPPPPPPAAIFQGQVNKIKSYLYNAVISFQQSHRDYISLDQDKM